MIIDSSVTIVITIIIVVVVTFDTTIVTSNVIAIVNENLFNFGCFLIYGLIY